MPKPNIFVSHRWGHKEDYYSLVRKFEEYGFSHLDYSVPNHDPLDANTKKKIREALQEQVRQSNYFIIMAKMAAVCEWCQYELQVAQAYYKPILGVKPWGYTGNVPVTLRLADNQGGPVGFNTPPIIRKICSELSWPIPSGI